MTVMEETPPTVIKSSDLLLKTYSPIFVGWPKGTLTLKQITKNLRECKYKYTYTDKTMKEEEIMKMMTNNVIEITNDCFVNIEDNVFRKIRLGVIKEHTPPKGAEERRRQS